MRPHHIDELIHYNSGKWGGRFNPFIPTGGTSISSHYWALLRAFDPDVITSLVPLDVALIKQLEARLSPYHVHSLRQHSEDARYFSVHLSDEGLSILPTLDNVRRAARAIEAPTGVAFQITNQTDPAVAQFIRRSLGTYTHVVAVDRALEQNRTKKVPITDRESLAAVLPELSTFESFVYPLQLCALPNHLPDVQHNCGSPLTWSSILDSYPP